MNPRLIRHIWMFAVLALLGLGTGSLRFAGAQEVADDGEPGVDVLTHGPIHEAFAEAVVFDPEPGIVAPKAPPDPINEIPPEQKPEGDVEWIPGYWAWDDDRSDFIWVSGMWRVIPPERQWIPGYWVRSEGGFQWISGYWAAENVSDTAYLPEPPESVEVGPNVSAPSPNYTWMPGSWIWIGGQYAWRPGYWAVMRPDWVWVPAHYVWSPRGYIFVGGYWDFAVTNRGVLFAPVSFGISVTVGPGFYFTPSFMIDLRVFSDSLFWWPRYHHYYFGDYYAPRYYKRGIFPWFSPHARRHGYDPIYAHQRWKHRRDPNWEKNLRTTYQTRRKYEVARPPRTLHDPKKSSQKPMVLKASGVPFKKPFVPVTKSREGMAKFKPLSTNERAQIKQRGDQVRNLSNKRLKLESPKLAKPHRGTSKTIQPNRAKLPKSPIASSPTAAPSRPTAGPSKPGIGPTRPTGRAPTKMTPPERPKAPQTNPTVEPLQRRPSGIPGTSKRIEPGIRTPPKSPTSTAKPPTRPTPPKVAPSGRQHVPQPQRTPPVQGPQSRPSVGRERNMGAGPNARGSSPQFPGR
ncbi:MAG: hypothetical protein ACQEQ7_05910 [Thermodesulfobacteriota bacterium]